MSVNNQMSAFVAQIVQNDLSNSAREGVEEFLKENPKVFLSSRQDIVEAWLNWNGIFGYSTSIIDVVVACMKPIRE